jgi:hypothetical protein
LFFSLEFVSVLLWDILLTFSISDDERVRKSAFDIFFRFSDETRSFPAEVLPRKICESFLETCGSDEAVAIVIKTIVELESNVTGTKPNTDDQEVTFFEDLQNLLTAFYQKCQIKLLVFLGVRQYQKVDNSCSRRLGQGFSTFWYSLTPKSKTVPKLYNLNE